MKALRRVFKYVWPQWPRVIVVVICAMVVAFLLSLSFMTIIPLLKVMMGKEGLHGWVDRKTCHWKYGVDFYVPDTADFGGSDSRDIAYYLLVTDVKKGSLGEAAGLKPADKIIGVGDFLFREEGEKHDFPRCLKNWQQPTKAKLDFR